MNNKTEKLLEDINKKLNSILIYISVKEENVENKIKILCSAGLKSEQIGNLVGMTGRGVRKNKAYKE